MQKTEDKSSSYSFFDRIPFIKHAFADQDSPVKNEKIAELDAQKPTLEKEKEETNGNDSFWKRFLAKDSGKEEITSDSKQDEKALSEGLFYGLTSPLTGLNIYEKLLDILASPLQTVPTTKKYSSKSLKKDFFESFGLSQIFDVFADPTVIKEFAGISSSEKFSEESTPSKNPQQKKLKKKANPVSEVNEEAPIISDSGEQDSVETDDLLEAFKMFLRGYNFGKIPQKKNLKKSDDIKSEFKIFLQTKVPQDPVSVSKEEELKITQVNYEAALNSMQSTTNESGKPLDLTLSAILKSFLVDEPDVKQNKDGKSEKALGNYVLDVVNHFLTKQEVDGNFFQADKEKSIDDIFDSEAPPKNEKSQTQNEWNTGKSFFETLLVGGDEEPIKCPKNNQKPHNGKENGIPNILRAFLVGEENESEAKLGENQRAEILEETKNTASGESADFLSFLSVFLADTDWSGKSDPKKIVKGAHILSLFQSLMAQEKSSKNGMKSFLDVFESFLADGNDKKPCNDRRGDISDNDPFYLNVQSVLVGDNDKLNVHFEDVKKLAKYLKQFVYTDENQQKSSPSPHDDKKGNLDSFYSLLENAFAA